MSNKIINGDCIEEMKKMPDNSVDSVVTDPPYDLVSINKRFSANDSVPAKFGKDGSFTRLFDCQQDKRSKGTLFLASGDTKATSSGNLQLERSGDETLDNQSPADANAKGEGK